MNRELDSRINVDSLRKQAKAWLKALRGGDDAARARLAVALPDTPSNPGLRDVQLALAREFGLPGWTALGRAIADLALDRQDQDELAELLLRSAWQGDPVAAARIVARRPEIAQHSLHTAAMCGDIDAVRHRLTQDPSAATIRSGPHDWAPLLYLAYGRIPGSEIHAVEIATLLLDHGADPTARFDDGWGNPFTLFGGVIGQGETNRPEHPHAIELADLFIARGTEPYDTQVLYDTSLRGDDTRWLDYLWDKCAVAGSTGHWRDPARGFLDRTMLDYLLGNAVGFRHVRRVAWLLEHGADPDASHAYSRRPLHMEAQFNGASDIATLLVRHGAAPVELSGLAGFIASCMRLDLDEARRQADAHPAYLKERGAVILAAQQGLEPAIAMLLDLGADPNAPAPDGKRALHWAAQKGHLGVARQLIAAGAEIDPRETSYGATPLGFAVHFGQATLVDLLAARSRDLGSLVAAARTDRITELLDAEPGLLTGGDGAGEPLLFRLPDDPEAALHLTELLLDHGADPRATNGVGETPAKFARRRGLDDAADAIDAALSSE